MPSRVAELQLAGINSDLPRHLVPPGQWTSGRNVNMRQGVSARIEGSAEIFSGVSAAQATWLFPVLTETAAYWIYSEETAGAGSDTDIYVTDGASAFDITPVGGVSTGGLQNPFTAALLNGVPCFNWQTEAPAFWGLDTAVAAADLTGWEASATCKALRAHRNYLIAMDYTDGTGDRFQEMVRWSDAAEPGTVPVTWTPAPDNDAGFLTASETPGPVIDGATLRDSFMLFKNNSTYRLRFIGGQFVFALERAFVTTGVLTRNCVAEFFGQLLCFADGDITLTDGASVRSIADQRTRRTIFSQINGDAFQRAFVAHYPAQKEVWCCFPTGASEYPDLAAVWDTERDQWSFRDLANVQFAASGIVSSTGSETWDGGSSGPWDDWAGIWDGALISQIEDELVVTIDAGGFAQIDSGDTDEQGADITATLARETFDFGKPQEVKTVRSVWPRLEGAEGDTVTVEVGEQMHVDEAVTWQPGKVFTIGTDRKVDIFARGRYLSFRFTSTGGAAWTLPGFAVEFGSIGGRY